MAEPKKLYKVVVRFMNMPGEGPVVTQNAHVFSITNITEKSYMVKWDGDDTPKRPRNIPKDSIDEVVIDIRRDTLRHATAHVWVTKYEKEQFLTLRDCLLEEIERCKVLADQAITMLRSIKA